MGNVPLYDVDKLLDIWIVYFKKSPKNFQLRIFMGLLEYVIGEL